tara:strand:- start:529 stop:1365 length:837 start_codon:yes stop_codon:yes gene_type:complete
MRILPFKILTLFLLSISLLSCASVNVNLPDNTRNTFVKIKQKVTITVCNPEDPNECLSKDSRSSGSGAVVKRTPQGSYVLTAGHVCSFERELELAKEIGAKSINIEMRSVNFKLAEYTSDIINVDKNIDTCLLFARNLYSVREAKMAAPLTTITPGDRVYNVAAPVGIFYEDIVPIMEGFFMGNKGLKAYYSIPAMGGSSGSPIFNKDSEIIGMIHSVNVYFPIVSVSPPMDLLVDFVRNSIRMGERMRLDKGEREDGSQDKTLWETLGLSKTSDLNL